MKKSYPVLTFQCVIQQIKVLLSAWIHPFLKLSPDAVFLLLHFANGFFPLPLQTLSEIYPKLCNLTLGLPPPEIRLQYDDLLQSDGMILLGRLILPRYHQFIGHVGHIATNHRHLRGGVNHALLSDVPLFDRLRLAAVLLKPVVLAGLWSGLRRGMEELQS